MKLLLVLTGFDGNDKNPVKLVSMRGQQTTCKKQVGLCHENLDQVSFYYPQLMNTDVDDYELQLYRPDWSVHFTMHSTIVI